MANPLGRFLRFIENLFTTGESEEIPKNELPPEEPPEFGGGGEPPDDESFDERMRAIWDDITNYDSTRNFELYREVYYDTGILSVEDDQDQIIEFWDEFLRAFYLTGHEPGSVSRDQWYSDVGLNRDRIDWAAWREIKRGTP